MTDATEKRKKAHGPTVNALKRAKFEAKQERRRQTSLGQQQQPQLPADPQQWRSWFNEDREEYAAFVTKEDVLRIKELKHNQHQSADNKRKAEDERLQRIASWIEPFFDLKGADALSAAQYNKEERLFISEGTETVRLMVQRCNGVPLDSTTTTQRAEDATRSESPPPVRMKSILCKPNTFFEAPVRLIDDVEKRISNNQPPFKVIIGSEDALSEIAGFNIARGALACGVVPTYFQTNGYEWLRNTIREKSTIRLLALDAVCDTANLGSIIRTAAALSVDAIILSDDSCDAFYRQCVRVSMGHVINVPTLRVGDWRRGFIDDGNNSLLQSEESGGLAQFITWLRVQMKVQCLAAVVDDEGDAEKGSLPPLISLESLTRSVTTKHLGSWCCVLGNEGNGIRSEVIKSCDERITISTETGVDSLSLPIAAAILIHGLRLCS
jgi:tRNA G18 (ribose-2'-O)-methylase SpoU